MSDSPDNLPTRAELARELLRFKMLEYADEFCASWLVDQEFYLYDAAVAQRFPHAENELATRVEFCVMLGNLGALAGGWWAWPSSEGHDPVFVPLAEWTERYARWQNVRRTQL
ncbi:hypothetical protein BH11VER1_BH11VER1_06710 [soil metagenome]